MHYFNLFREIVEKFSQFSCLYFLFLFHANPPTPAPSEENASPNKPRTFAGSPVFAAFDPLVPLEADPSVVVPAFFVTVGVALPFWLPSCFPFFTSALIAEFNLSVALSTFSWLSFAFNALLASVSALCNAFQLSTV